MAEVVKIEQGVEQPNICHGCLSQDRKTVSIPPGEVSQVFGFLLSQTYVDFLSTKVCWECVAMLKRFAKFRSRLLKAQSTLMRMYCLNTNIYTLSTLSTTFKSDYDQKYEHIFLIDDQNTIGISTESQPVVKVEIKREPISVVIVDEKQTDETNNEDDVDTFDNIGFDLASNTEFKEENKKNTENLDKKPKKNKNVPHNFIEHAIIKTSDTDWSKEKDTSKHFTDEYLDEAQVEEYVLKLERQSKPRWLIKCKTCKQYYPNKPDYLRHQNLNHREPDSPNNCLLCKKKFSTLEQLQDHWKHAHSCYSRCNMCKMYCKRRAQKKHLNYYHTKLYCCDQCGEELVTPKLFNVHYKEKHATFICQLCQRIFHYKRTLIKHLESTHRSLSCKYCNKNFKKAPYLAKHMIAFHSDTLNIPRDNESAYCVECDRNFISITRLKEHLKYSVKHAPPRPPKSIPCPECGKIFSRKTYMKNHYNCAHSTTKAKHVCTYCCKFFVTSGSLRRHYDEVHLKMPKLKDKICDFCGEGFAEKRTLVRHCRRAHAFVLE